MNNYKFAIKVLYETVLANNMQDKDSIFLWEFYKKKYEQQ